MRSPLAPAVAGGYRPGTGDVWVVHDPGDPDRAARTLLHELAHASRLAAPAATIDAYCDEELATDELARSLARAWGVAGLFRGDDPEAARERVEEYRGALTAAGELAGSLDPGLARRAYGALWTLAGREGWGREELHDAALGLSADPRADARALDFDRCALRSRWLLASRGGDGLGPLAIACAESGAGLLRDALGCVAHQGRPGPPRARGTGPSEGRGFLRLAGADDLPGVLAAANAALLAHPGHAALARWDVWGDSALPRTPRLYRLWVEYADGDRRDDDPSPRRLWILALPRRARDLAAEAALQRYVGGWREHTSTRVDDWWLGLEELAEHLCAAP